MVGQRSFAKTLYYEFCSWLAPIPGAVGLGLRKVFWPRLFGSCGSGVLFGANTLLRHPGRIHLGDNIVVSEGVVLDGRNVNDERAIVIADEAMLANNVSINCKGGTVNIGARTGIGAQTIIHSIDACPVIIGADAIIGPQCYIVGGGSYNMDRLDVPIATQGIKPDGGCHIEDNVWVGANASIMGGVTLAGGSVVAAGAVVTRSIPANTICAGVPAKVIKNRDGG